jgi:hypothetical protein
MKNKVIWRFAVAMGCVALFTGCSLVSAGASGTRETDVDVVREIAATGGQNEFSVFLSSALATFPDDVVDFSWHEDHGEIVVTARIVADVEQLATSHQVDVTVLESRPEAVAYLDRSSVELAALGAVKSLGVMALGARYDPTIGSVVLTIWSDPDSVVSDDTIQGVLGELEFPVLVEYEDTYDLPHEDASHGGEEYDGCTGSFMGNMGAAYGIFTAAHCTTKPATYDGSTTGMTYAATNDYDYRFTALVGSSAVNQFRYNADGELRNITSIGIVSAGSFIYKYGKTTGYSFSTTDSFAGCKLFSSGNTWCGLYQTTSKVTEGGDSGGPWFVGYTGYGSTTGSNSSASYITPVAYASYTGATVKTS